MGREAVCLCGWGGDEAGIEVKALLETGEVVLRGAIRRRVPFAEMRGVGAEGDRLRFEIGGEAVWLALGREKAAKWAKAIANPPTLASKLGITAETRVWMVGDVDDRMLAAALEEAKEVSETDGNLIVIRAASTAELELAFAQVGEQLAERVPVWVVFVKGPGQELNEHAVRAMGLARGIVDTKVASVSSRLTALRFVRRKG